MASSKVMMVGDGFNDCIALAQADVSIVIGSGVDIAHQTADCVLLSKNLNPLLTLIDLSQKTKKTIKQNIVFALVYNAITVPLAIMAYVTPLLAAILMPISSLIVIINASLLRKKIMDVIYWLIPSMLIVGIALVVILVIAVKKGQFDNLDSEGTRILFDEDE